MIEEVLEGVVGEVYIGGRVCEEFVESRGDEAAIGELSGVTQQVRQPAGWASACSVQVTLIIGIFLITNLI